VTSEQNLANEEDDAFHFLRRGFRRRGTCVCILLLSSSLCLLFFLCGTGFVLNILFRYGMLVGTRIYQRLPRAFGPEMKLFVTLFFYTDYNVKFVKNVGAFGEIRVF
jgi:hypothetical protein